MSLSFTNQHPSLSIPKSPQLLVWLRNTAKNEGFEIGRLSYHFISDEELYKMNVKFLDHDTYTDVITFDYNQDHIIIGEIYISLDRVLDNSKNTQNTYNQEVNRIIIHGFLHLLGYKDKKPNDKKEMTSKEDYYLSLHP